ncbi:MAG: nucleotidyltransferase domain-containing protein [Treponema sp.]|nr:nucleotidyltransferase domain-containing protein [Treponema sp.]
MLARSRLPVADVWLYGSYAYGAAGEDSDIDVAVRLERDPDDHLAASKLLFALRREIDIRLEPVLIDPEHDRSGFSEMVAERGIRAYP